MIDETTYAALGEEAGIAHLVDRFYAHMEADPAAAPIRAMHPPDLEESRRKLWMFLVGRFGGPDLYVAERGHPRLRARHMPFAVDGEAARQWMHCMDLALAECVPDAALRADLSAFFATVAEHMRNR